jgi:hypothetical protein
MSNIVLRVNRHPSGRHTLTESVDGHVPSDLRGPLFGNMDKAEFDRAKEEMAAELRREGHHVVIME